MLNDFETIFNFPYLWLKCHLPLLRVQCGGGGSGSTPKAHFRSQGGRGREFRRGTNFAHVILEKPLNKILYIKMDFSETFPYERISQGFKRNSVCVMIICIILVLFFALTLATLHFPLPAETAYYQRPPLSLPSVSIVNILALTLNPSQTSWRNTWTLTQWIEKIICSCW